MNANKRNEFQHKLFKDTTSGEHIICTVEVGQFRSTPLNYSGYFQLLHISKEDPSDTYIYVTDYTAHPKLSSYQFGKRWSRDLEGRIIAIHLRNNQARHAGKLREKSYLSIKNLHLVHSNIENRFQGGLGGPELLIHQLNTKNPNSNLQALLKCVSLVFNMFFK